MKRDTKSWLTELGLTQYIESFEQNDLDWDTLPDLGDDDLREIGVHSLGHRKKLLRAIANLASASQLDEQPQTAFAAPGGERRQITVMFCDLVGSTELSTRIDAEDMDDVIRRYQEIVTPIVHEFGGHVARFAGDGILSYFGYPNALEREAERAIRTGLKVVAAIDQASLHPGEQSSVRIGIATGGVVIGDLYDSGKLYEAMATGETPNLAARLQGCIGPGGIAVCSSTRQMARDVCDFADEGKRDLRGFSDAVRIWSVIERQVNDQQDAPIVSGESRSLLEGRQEERDQLLASWQNVEASRGKTVLVQGAAGLGKSSVVRAFLQDLPDATATQLHLYCEPYHQATPFYAVVDLLRRAVGMRMDEAPEAQVKRLEQFVVGRYRNEETAVPLLANLLDISNDAHNAVLMRLSPQRLKEDTIETMVGSVELLAEAAPVAFFVEDLHWADASTLQFLDALHQRIDQLPVILLLTARPEFELDWQTSPGVERIDLSPLGNKSSMKIVRQVSGDVSLPESICRKILEKSEGVPLFIEELTKNLVEEIRHRGDDAVADERLEAAAVPDSLQNTLLARLDRLGEVKNLALYCSVFGGEFEADLVALVVERSTEELQTALLQLVDAELLREVNRKNRVTYVFRHALLRDAAYNNLLKRNRRDIHLKIAEVITSHYPQVLATRPESLARHYTAGEDYGHAIEFWLAAGGKALRSSANIEAVEHLRQGLTLLEKLSDPATAIGLELQLQMTLGPALIAIRGFAADDVRDAFGRAREICETIGDPASLFLVLRGLMAYYIVRADYESALDIGRQLEEELKEAHTADQMVELLWNIGSAQLYNGQVREAIEKFEAGVQFYDMAEHAKHAFVFGQDPGVAGMTHLAHALTLAGQYDRAREIERDVVELVEQLSHPFTSAQAGSFLLANKRARLELDSLDAAIDKTLALSKSQGFPVWEGMTLVYKGWNAARKDDASGIDCIDLGMTTHAATGALIARTEWLRLNAEAHLLCGDIDRGLSLIDLGCEHAEKYDERLYEPGLYAVKGQLLLKKDAAAKEAEAIAAFKKAIDLASDRSLHHFELVAAIAWAEFENGGGNVDGDGHKSLQAVAEKIDMSQDDELVQRAGKLLGSG